MVEIIIHDYAIYSSMRHKFVKVNGELEYSTHGGKGYFAKVVFSDDEFPEKPRKVIAHSDESIDAVIRSLAIINGYDPVGQPHFEHSPKGDGTVSVELQYKGQKYRGTTEFENPTYVVEAAIRSYFDAMSKITGKMDIKFQKKGLSSSSKRGIQSVNL